MISKSEPLSAYIAQYEDAGYGVGVYPTQDGKRYALRLFNPEDPKTGLGFLMAFSKNFEKANRPTSAAARTKSSNALYDLVHDQFSGLNAVTCVIDEESVAGGFASESDLGKTFVIAATGGTAEADSDFGLSSKESKRDRSVSAD